MMKHLLLLLVACGLAARICGADSMPPHKSGHHLFNPTARDHLREMSTDRPDQTESAHTVDAGHFQVEMDFMNATFDRNLLSGSDERTTVWGITPLNLKVGLLNDVDIQFLLDTHVRSRAEDRLAGTVVKNSGFGDFQTRLKVNLWGNDGGKTALAIMPYVKWPLSQSGLRNGRTEGGIIIPLGVALSDGWGMGLMTEFDFVGDATQTGYDTEFVNSITFSHDIAAGVGGYVEFFSVVSTARDSQWQGQADLGFTHALNEMTQLDFGCNFGVTDSAPDFNPFVGMSWRY